MKKEILNEHTKCTKPTKIMKIMSSKEDWLYFLISNKQPTLLKIGYFWKFLFPCL